MPTFEVHVTIENKPGLSDPEGDTILHDLVLKESNVKIKNVKTAKLLKFTIIEKDKKSAKDKIKKICDELRIYNPVVSSTSYKVMEV